MRRFGSISICCLALAGCVIPAAHGASMARTAIALVPIEAGVFQLGSPESEAGHQEDEGPQVRVDVPAFQIARYEVTVGQYREFIEDSGYVPEFGCLVLQGDGPWEYDPDGGWNNPGFAQEDDHPVVCVSWNDAQAYVRWLNQSNAYLRFRLPSEAEWAFAAKAGGTTPYWWGEKEGDFCSYTNGADAVARAQYPSWPMTGACEDGFVHTAPVGHYSRPNAFGVEDMVGNVWEWTADCYVATHSQNPADGTAVERPDCEKRVMRGGAWGDYGSFYLRTAYRGAWDGSQAFSNLGFRVAADKHER